MARFWRNYGGSAGTKALLLLAVLVVATPAFAQGGGDPVGDLFGKFVTVITTWAPRLFGALVVMRGLFVMAKGERPGEAVGTVIFGGIFVLGYEAWRGWLA